MIDLLEQRKIVIVSGEGSGQGTTELYKGKHTEKELNKKLIEERCLGQRWANAFMQVGPECWVNVESKELDDSDFLSLIESI